MLRTADEETIRELLKPVKGIGPWTADMFIMFHIQLPDVLPTGDLGIRKGVARHFDLRSPPKGRKGKAERGKDGYFLPTPEEMEVLCEKWKPWRSVASWYMWRLVDTVTM